MSFIKVTVEKYAFPFLLGKYFSLTIISALLDSLMLVYTAGITMIFDGERQENIIKKIETHSTYYLSGMWCLNV